MLAIDLDEAIVLPSGLGAENPNELFSLCAEISNCASDIVIDASNLSYVDPLGMATLRALFEDQLNHKRITIQFLPKNLTSYLARMDFFKGLDIEGVDLNRFARRNDRASTLVEITKVTEHHQAEEIASRLANAITGKLTLSGPDAPVDERTGRNEFDSYRWPIEYSLKELLENSLTHARREGSINAAVWVACQYYPKRNMVRMAIVDNGCGFLATLSEHPELIEKTDCGAIRAALKPRISCNRGSLARVLGSENQGVGLTTTAKIAEAAGGGLIVASGNAIHQTEYGRFHEMDERGWQGVSIGFYCVRELLPGVSISALLPADEDGLDEIELDLNFR